MTNPTKEALITTTLALIIETQDMRTVSSRAIARRSGVALGLITYHFGGKEQLMREAVRRFISQVIDQWGRDSSQTNDPVRSLKLALESLCAFIWEHPRVARTSINFDLENPDPSDNTHQTISRLSQLIAQITRLPPDAPTPVERARILVFTIQGTFLRDMESRYQEKQRRTEWLDRLVDLVLADSGT